MKFCLTTLVIFACGVSMSVRCQTTAPSRVGRTDTVQREQQRQVEMQMIERALSTDGRAPQVKRYSPATLDIIRSDFLEIQVADRRLIKATTRSVDLDLKLVGQLTGEIRKRSRRLKDNLALPEPATQTPSARLPATVETSPEALRTSLANLSDLIESFVSNPMFEQSKLLDAKLSDKASEDLDAIIRLSDEIRHSSEKLSKSQK